MNLEVGTPSELGCQLAFVVGGRHHSIPLASIQEVLRLPLLQAPDGQSYCIAGLLNLRGRLIRVLDLARRLGFPPHPPDLEDSLIVLHDTDWGLWVQQVEGVLEAGLTLSEGMPIEAQAEGCFLRGMEGHGTDIYRLLDLEAALGAPFPAGSSESPFLQVGPEVLAVFQARAEAILEAPTQEAGTLQTLLSFELGSECYALDVKGVREIIPCPPIHIIPGAPVGFLGLVSHRGEPHLVVDPGSRVGLPPSPVRAGGALIVAAVEGRVALYANAVQDVIRLDREQLHPPPVEQDPGMPIEGIWVVDGHPVSLLSLSSLIDSPSRLPVDSS